MPKQYDLVAIGSGTAASVAASRCRAAGWQVAVIDHLPFGGTCALRGCDPKEVLVGIADVVDAARRLRGNGIEGGEPSINWRGDSSLRACKFGNTEDIPGYIAASAGPFDVPWLSSFKKARLFQSSCAEIERKQLAFCAALATARD